MANVVLTPLRNLFSYFNTLKGKERFDVETKNEGIWLLRDSSETLEQRSIDFNDTGNRLFRELSRSFIIGYGIASAYTVQTILSADFVQYTIFKFIFCALVFLGLTLSIFNSYLIARHFTAAALVYYSALKMKQGNANAESISEIDKEFYDSLSQARHFRNLYRLLTLFILGNTLSLFLFFSVFILISG